MELKSGRRYLVTGGAGFIGSHLIKRLLLNSGNTVCNIDKLTYASDLSRLAGLNGGDCYQFVQADIADSAAVAQALHHFQPHIVINLAAESHVDNSIQSSEQTIATNVLGVQVLLEASRNYWQGLAEEQRNQFRFYQISTDEVFGDFNDSGSVATAESAYRPSSPYSASKAAADHLVRAWHRTYGLPVLISTSSNNFGAHQHSEKLIPMVIERALAGQPIGLYGDGQQQRDWLYVEDHVAAIELIAEKGQPDDFFLISAETLVSNKHLVETLCLLLDELSPSAKLKSYAELIRLVTDRPGHDRCYASDASKVKSLGWLPQTLLREGLRKTVLSFLAAR
ncbi:dTDP-glucose 4,6-dehydratase [Teredinibacter haidensis]|uniref:dTDP-glucose 4,6-dehydratase n=1 Tax=Teredinibacter haidensis TaxID=2731755 RepID=UPI000AF7D5EF|nr:dTDP-glucose 4,6-dehydratase [Teredinibacter haidensis]